MTGLSLNLNPSGKDFVLRRVAEDGATTEMVLSAIDVLTLAGMAPSLRQRALSLSHPSITDKSLASAISAMEAADFQLHPEKFGEQLILILIIGTSGSSNAAFALPINIATRLAQEIPEKLTTMQTSNPTRQ